MQHFFKHNFPFIAVIFLTIGTASAQEKFTLSGYVRDKDSGEEMIGATVYDKDLHMGATTNQYGFYSLTLTAGQHQVIYQYLGYEPQTSEINLDKNIRKDIELKQAPRQLEEIIVSGNNADAHIRSTQMGSEKLSPRQIKNLPVLFGEQDILKTMQLLPGISSVGEGNSGFYVRGGDASQNLILLDEAPVYNASHLLGFFSIFNSDAIKDAKIMKGFIPPNYGGRLSSVVDIKMKEGNSKVLSGAGGLGVISSRLQIESPINHGKGSFMITGRRTYADLFLKMLPDTNLNNNALYFYDFNAKVNYRTSKKDRIFLSGYLGRDVFKYKEHFGFDWGNKTLSFRWNHLFNDRLFLNSSLIYSNYNYNFNIMNGENKFVLHSFIRDINWKEDFQFYPSSRHTFRFGFKINHHQFMPGEVSSSGNFPINDIKMETKVALENAVYLSHEWKAADFLTLHYGLRVSSFSLLGPAHIYSYDNQGNVTDTTSYQHHNFIKTYWNADPRILLNFRTSAESSVKLSYSHMHQYLHLLSNTTSGTPLDLWVPSSTIVKPQTANMFSVGYFFNFKKAYEASLEVYFKTMHHQIEYKNGADIFLNELVESQLVFGEGKAYGTEILIKKNAGHLHGWISYTLSRSLRTFPDINNGHTFPAKQDRIHDVSLVALYDLNERWTFSATWVYSTGNAVTFPSGKYVVENQYINYFTERNGYRMPPYHRLDIGINYNLKKKERKSKSSFNFSIYNVYARKNAYSITFRTKKDDPGLTEAVKLYLFSMIPTITYNFSF